MKERYERAEVEMMELEAEDIIRTSGGEEDETEPL